MGILETLAKELLDNDDEPAKPIAKGGAQRGAKEKLSLAQVGLFVQAAVGMVSKIGLPKLIAMFKAAGLEKQVLSWIGKGKNEPIQGAQVEKAVGPDFISKLAKKVGIEPVTAAATLARYLPKVVDALTPDGKPDDERVKKEAGGFDLGDIGDLVGGFLKKG